MQLVTFYTPLKYQERRGFLVFSGRGYKKETRAWCPPSPKRWGDFNFEKLKSLGERVFFHQRGGGQQVHMGEGDGGNGNQRGA